MHEDEPAVDAALVRRLVEGQFPAWADLPIRPVASDGTTNTIWRLGDEMSVRMPRVDYGVNVIAKEERWLAALAPQLPLAIPTQLATGRAGEGFPFAWSVHRWIDGDVATRERIDAKRAALDLAAFLVSLRAIDTTDGPLAAERGLRAVPLRTLDPRVRREMGKLRDEIDVEAATALWESGLDVSDWDQEPVWCHGDMASGNLLVENGRLRAVIDFGSVAVGDPACDLVIAWGLFSGADRQVFREAVSLDDDAWVRGRAHAVYHAVVYIPYYRDKNPAGVEYARHLLAQALADEG